MPILCGLDLGWSNTDDGGETKVSVDDDAVNLSYVGTAAYNALRVKHFWFHHRLWDVTSGRVIEEVHQTPGRDDSWGTEEDPSGDHSIWFPEKMCEIIARTEFFCDIMSLGPPDGLFLENMKKAFSLLSAKKKEITIRLMIGNIVGMPVNCDKVIKKLTEDLPKDTQLQIWVGAWRKGASWNHAKIIAVDGRFLHTGGHNLWDPHYLRNTPVHDLSIEMEGRITHDGHLFANEHWNFIREKQSTSCGQLAENIPDNLPLIWKVRVIVSEFPEGKASEFPPLYNKRLVPSYEKLPDSVPVISIGRLGSLVYQNRPADDAILGMIESAKTIIHMALQDLGPVCIPGTKMALPGLTWPKEVINALARRLWLDGVDIEIVLSNPGSIPNGLSPTEACYGNGWSCVDVASEIIKGIRKQFPMSSDNELIQKVKDNLRVCFVRQKQGNKYSNGETIGFHSKHFIIDDICTYIGSQNLYVCDLAEWGVVIDHEEQTKKIMNEYWNPMWSASYTGEDCQVEDVMNGLDINRDGEIVNHLSSENMLMMENAARADAHVGNSEYYDDSD